MEKGKGKLAQLHVVIWRKKKDRLWGVREKKKKGRTPQPATPLKKRYQHRLHCFGGGRGKLKS